MLTPARQRRQLRSPSSKVLAVPSFMAKTGTRAFSVAAPTLWNTLADNTKSTDDVVTFRCYFNTYLFNLSPIHPHVDDLCTALDSENA